MLCVRIMVITYLIFSIPGYSSDKPVHNDNEIQYGSRLHQYNDKDQDSPNFSTIAFKKTQDPFDRVNNMASNSHCITRYESPLTSDDSQGDEYPTSTAIDSDDAELYHNAARTSIVTAETYEATIYPGEERLTIFGCTVESWKAIGYLEPLNDYTKSSYFIAYTDIILDVIVDLGNQFSYKLLGMNIF